MRPAISLTRTRAIGIIAVCGLTAGAIAVVLSSAPPEDQVVAAIVYGLLVAVPAGVGLAALARRPEDRFARLLLATSVLWALTALVETSAPLTYSVGRVATWLVEAAVVYLLLAFPSGHLTTTLERRTFGATVALVGLLYLPTAPLVDHYPEPTAGSSCIADCPANAFAVTSSEPALVGQIVRPLRETLTVVIFLLVVGILARRTRRAGPMVRRALIPVTATAALRATAFPLYFVLRESHPDSAALTTLGWIALLLVTLIPLSFGAGLVVRRLYGALALQDMALRLSADTSVAELRGALALALEDPSLRLVFWRPGDGGQWIDETGLPVRAPCRSTARDVTEVASPGRRTAAIEHDALLAQDPAIMRAAGAYAMIVLDNRRLFDELRASLGELSASRARIAAVGDEARRRIERDLHDGAQQRLVAIRIKLARESERVSASSPENAEALEALGLDVEATIDDVRALAHGIYPSLLADRGLPDALRAVALGSSISTSLETDGVGRYSPKIESTVYFACLEALQNAAKHARGASHVDISLSVDRALEFVVSDDGDGFDPSTLNGGGLTNLRDRLTAVDGSLEVASHPGHGTRVSGSVPVS